MRETHQETDVGLHRINGVFIDVAEIQWRGGCPGAGGRESGGEGAENCYLRLGKQPGIKLKIPLVFGSSAACFLYSFFTFFSSISLSNCGYRDSNTQHQPSR